MDKDGQGTTIEMHSLVDLLLWRTQQQPDQRVYTFLLDGEAAEAHLTYRDLDCQARAIAAQLQAAMVPGSRVLLLYPPGLEFIAAFWGCLYAGVVAVPTYPPQRNRPDPRFQAILQDAQPAAALTTSSIFAHVQYQHTLASQSAQLRWIITDPDLDDAGAWHPPLVDATTLAFLQYTSGSTAQPKGVMLTHGNLLHNLGLIQHGFQHTAESRGVIWLPPYHDMGLIGGILQPLYAGFPVTLMAPTAFLQRPFRWLDAISRFKATTSGGPNFAYDLCVRKITPEQCATLDLRSWRVAFNGAEPIRADTLDRFAAKFEPYGFCRTALYPCYGLAEATLLVTGGSPGTEPGVRAASQHAAVESSPVSHGGLEPPRILVSSGQPVQDTQLCIVDPRQLSPCPAGELGEVWVSGPSVAQGYWNRPEETERVFRAYTADANAGPFLRTGDLGYMVGNELFVTGRLKDVIIIRGRNLYPQDIEQTVEESHPALRPGAGAAFTVERDGDEQLIVVQEVERQYRKVSIAEVAQAIRHTVAAIHAVHVAVVVLIKPGSLPKTTSGKVQRYLCRSRYIAGSLDVIDSSGDTVVEIADADPPISHSALLAVPPAERAALLFAFLRRQLADVLRGAASNIDRQDSLLTLGLDSLMVMDLRGRFQSHLGIDVSIDTLLTNQSLDQLVSKLLIQVEASPPALPIQPTGSTGQYEYPLGAGQQALWFLYQLAPASAAYHIARAVRIRTPINLEAFERAFQTLVDRHAALRTTFVERSDGPVHQVHPHMLIRIEVEDATSWSATTLKERLTEAAQRPFDLAQGPPFRVQLFRRGPADHLVVFVVHHIVADLWSIALLFHELGSMYSPDESAAPLAALPFQYSNFVRWHADHLAGPSGETHWHYWQQQLADAIPRLDLPTDRPRPALQTYRGATYQHTLDAALTQWLKICAQTEGVTLYMLLVAAFQTLLYRYTGQSDLLLGSTASGRSRPEFAGVIGYFASPIVLRARALNTLTFRALLDQVRGTVLDALDHQEYPFPWIVERLQPERDPSRTPLFQVAFVLDKPYLPEAQMLAPVIAGEAGVSLTLGPLTIESYPLTQPTAQFDVTLLMVEGAGGLSAAWEYNTDLFDGVTIKRMAAHFEALLTAIDGQLHQPITRLPLVTGEERTTLLATWNATEHRFKHESVLDAFAQCVAHTPDAIAVSAGNQCLTYHELDRRTSQLACYLRAQGLAPEARVGVFIERSVDLVVGVLSILKASAVYLPLDPAYPAARVGFMLEDAQAAMVLTHASLLENLPLPRIPTICLDRDWPTIEQAPRVPLAWPLFDQLAYIIYTSGSTGLPKGVMLTHGGLCNLALAQIKRFGVQEQSRILQFASCSFDASISEIFMALLAGATLVIEPQNALLPGGDLSQVLQARAIDVVTLPPAALTALGAVELPQLNTLIVAGEACAADLVRQWAAGRRFFNAYGPTEITVCATIAECRSDPAPPPIGRPLANVRAYILDDELEPVPIGVTGQLYIGGVGVARGYLNQPALTAACFIPDPFGSGHTAEGSLGMAPSGGARLYRTGDLARYRADGCIEFLGRQDRQVKLRGFRIELHEIEAALLRHPAVRQAAVVLDTHALGEQRLVAYVALLHGSTDTPRDLREFLQRALPHYMLPAVIMLLESLPLSANGKIDYRTLPPIPIADVTTSQPAPDARTPLEEIVGGLWCQILGVEQANLDDNFFDLGGHSLLATRFFARLRDVLLVDLPIRTIFETPTLGALVERVAAARHYPTEAHAPILQPSTHHGVAPLSFAQQRLWFLEQFEPGVPYHIPAAVHLDGPLDSAALEHSLNAVIQRHQVLRTTFALRDGQPVQVLAPTLELPLPVLDLQSMPLAERMVMARQQAIAEARVPFDLRCGPLLRARLLQLDSAEHILLLILHHIIADGWSMGVLIRDLGRLYAAYSQPQSALQALDLPALPVQYADYAIWQRQWLKGTVLARQLDYWQRQLAHAPPLLRLPTDRQRPAVQTYAGASCAFMISRDLTAALNTISRDAGATLFMTLLAAFKTLLHRYTGEHDLVVGANVANRTQSELEHLIGFFVNMLVLRTQFLGASTFRDVLSRVREVTLDAYAHQDLPFEKLVEVLRPKRDLSYTPLFQVVFALQNTPTYALDLPGVRAQVLDIDPGIAKFDLLISLEERSDGLAGTVTYRTDLFDAPTITRLIEQFQILLSQIATQPDLRIDTSAVSADAERKPQPMDTPQRGDSSLKSVRGSRRKAVNLEQEHVVHTDMLAPELTMPLVIQPAIDGVNLATWAAAEQDMLTTALRTHGAVLFRGFAIDSPAAFEQVVHAINPDLFGEYGDLPREGVAEKIYTSTPYPPDQAILFHNEGSHLHQWPGKIWFFCAQPAQQGGATPIVDCRTVYQRLDPAIRAKFEQKHLMYVRTFVEGLDVSWQQFFQTSDRSVVEGYCREANTACEWLDGNQLRTRQMCQGVIRHPHTGEPSFFNQIQLHHVSCLAPAVRDAMLAMFPPDRFPRNVYYGDGSPIEDAVVQEILGLYEETAVRFAWQRGDILMLDNMLVAHGRDPYVVPRKILVAMAEITTATQVA